MSDIPENENTDQAEDGALVPKNGTADSFSIADMYRDYFLDYASYVILERAVPDLNVEQDEELFKEAHYLLSRISEELGDKETAEKHYGEVLVIDYEYKDARERLEKLQGG